MSASSIHSVAVDEETTLPASQTYNCDCRRLGNFGRFEQVWNRSSDRCDVDLAISNKTVVAVCCSSLLTFAATIQSGHCVSSMANASYIDWQWNC